jgi:hypothetical protein
MRHLLVLIVIMLFVSACGALKPEVLPSPIPTEDISTEISEGSLIATEQFMAAMVKTQAALTMAAQPTFTPMPTLTSTLANLPTLTPIPNSTPGWAGAFFDVSPDVLGSRYEIRNACYFDTQSGWERREVYAGALAGSGDEYSAQGVVVIRVFRVGGQESNPSVELVSTREHLTENKEGPLRLPAYDEGGCHDDWMSLRTPLDFMWILNPMSEEFFQDFHTPPLARMEIGENTQLARRGSFCWKGGCADGPAISTSSTPLVIGSSEFAHLSLPLEEPPYGLSLSAMFVSPPGRLEYEYSYGDNAEWSYETPGREQLDLGSLPLQREQDIKFSLKLGYYALTVLAVWKDYGDVKYGFLIEVQE